MITAAIEKELIDALKDFFKKDLKAVAPLGGAWNESTIRHVIKTAPAIYVAYIGSRRARQPSCVTATWALFISARTLNAMQDRANAYYIKDALIAFLHRRKLPGAASGFEYTQDANLYSETQAVNGMTVYGVYFDVLQPLPDSINSSEIGDFETYYHKFKCDPEMESLNTLPIIQEQNHVQD